MGIQTKSGIFHTPSPSEVFDGVRRKQIREQSVRFNQDPKKELSDTLAILQKNKERVDTDPICNDHFIESIELNKDTEEFVVKVDMNIDTIVNSRDALIAIERDALVSLVGIKRVIMQQASLVTNSLVKLKSEVMAIIVSDNLGKRHVIVGGTDAYEYDPSRPDCKGKRELSGYDRLQLQRKAEREQEKETF